MKIKRLLAVCMLLIFVFSFTGCAEQMVIDNTYDLELLKDGTVALGDVYTAPSNGALFIPSNIDSYTVTQLGYNFGRFKGNYKAEGRDTNATRFYSPNSIKRVEATYMLFVNYLKIFYCGEITDLTGLAVSINSDESGIYVPADLYDDFFEATQGYSARCMMKKANVAYMLDENTYYYVDYYETDSKILYIPPVPEKQGYTFEGWCTDKAFTNEWNFDTDTILNSEEETKLYANWIEN